MTKMTDQGSLRFAESYPGRLPLDRIGLAEVNGNHAVVVSGRHRRLAVVEQLKRQRQRIPGPADRQSDDPQRVQRSLFGKLGAFDLIAEHQLTQIRQMRGQSAIDAQRRGRRVGHPAGSDRRRVGLVPIDPAVAPVIVQSVAAGRDFRVAIGIAAPTAAFFAHRRGNRQTNRTHSHRAAASDTGGGLEIQIASANAGVGTHDLRGLKMRDPMVRSTALSIDRHSRSIASAINTFWDRRHHGLTRARCRSFNVETRFVVRSDLYDGPRCSHPGTDGPAHGPRRRLPQRTAFAIEHVQSAR